MKNLAGVLLSLFALLVLCGFTPEPGRGGAKRVRDSEFFRILEQGYESGMYRQDSLLLVDPVGDAFLLRKLDTIPTKLFYHLFCAPMPQNEGLKDVEPFTIGRSVPINTDRLLNKCAEIMRSHFPDIFPSVGPEHEWSREAEQYLRFGFWHRLGRHWSGKQKDFPAPTLGCSKLLVCLACGWTSRYCVTGTEDALIKRALAYPDRGIMPHNLFEESYLLNGGDLYLTLLTCENILAGMPFRPGREEDPFQKKLAYIRHDSKESGDNYGAWYHFFGIALYALMRPESTSRFVAGTESFGSFFFEGPDRQENIINKHGALFGRRLRTMLEDASWWLRTEETDYLLPNPLR